MADLTLREAAEILGVPIDADRDAIDKASRQLIRKWHPDAWRNASESDQKRAADEFMLVSKAQRIMHHPDEATPEEPAPQERGGYPEYQPYGYPQRGQQPQYGDGYGRYGDAGNGYGQASTGNDTVRTYASDRTGTGWHDQPSRGGERIGHNSATSFEDSFGQIPDTMEQVLNDMHNKDVTASYKRAADMIRPTSSAIASILTFIVSFFMLTIVLGTGDPASIQVADGFLSVVASLIPATAGNPTAATFGAFCLLMLLKIVTYDAFISYHLVRKIKRLSPVMLFGIECGLMSIAGIILGGALPITRATYGCLLLLGLVCIVIGMFWSMRQDSEE